MSEAMTKIRIITPHSVGVRVIDTLYNLSLFHVNPSNGEYNLGKGNPLATAESLSSSLLKAKAILQEFGSELLSHERTFGKKEMNQLETVHHDVFRLRKQEQTLTSQLQKATEEHEISSGLDALGIDRTLVQKLHYVACFVGFCAPETLQSRLKVTHEFKQVPLGQKILCALFVQKKDELLVRVVLQETGWVQVAVEQYMTSTAQLKKQITHLTTELRACEKEKEQLRKAHAQFITDVELYLDIEIKKAELPLQFATTAQSFVATGFVPSRHLARITKTLEYATRKRVTIEELHVDHDEAVPVQLANKKTVRSFEVLTKLYELPSYFEADPTSLLFITFPLFFGIMLGDVGYGFVTLALFLFLRKKKPDIKAWCNVLIYASIVSIFFGFVYGEYFGFESVSVETGTALCKRGLCLAKEIVEGHGALEVVYTFPRLLNRVHGMVAIGNIQLLSILALGIAIGAVHINLGLLIGFYNVWKAHGLKLAVLEKLSWIVLEIGLAVLVLSLSSIIPVHWIVGTLIMVVSVIGLYLGEGPKGLVEIPALFSNMLSYMRLGAVGLASVGLAVVVNENLALPMFEKGGFFIIGGMLIMLVGHGINIALGVIGPFLHSVRLHYVEFFSKFYKGGGIEYTPFGAPLRDT